MTILPSGSKNGRAHLSTLSNDDTNDIVPLMKGSRGLSRRVVHEGPDVWRTTEDPTTRPGLTDKQYKVMRGAHS
jgi:hypothetical protein